MSSDVVRHAVVPAGGRGTRMLPATRSVPKELLPLGVTPVLDVILAELRRAGLAEIVVVGAPDKPAIDAHVAGDDHVRVVRQPEPRGLGDAVLQAADAVGDAPFAVALPDALVPDRLLPALLERVAAGFDGAVALEPVPAARAGHYGTARLDRDGTITRLAEKAPAEPGATEALAVAARYVLPGATFDALRRTAPGHGGEVQLTDALADLIAQGARLAGVVLRPGERRRDVGSPAGYAAAFAEHALADAELSPAIREVLRAGGLG
jgi:UTP--glucose-1-phosphate uridylyltransferase